jgi:hypothetical protein
MLSAWIATAALTLSMANASKDDGCRPGGWCSVPVTAAMTALLVQALGNRANYAASIHKPVCVHSVLRVRQQVVAGMNYLFEVNACPVEFTAVPSALGKCKSACRVAPFEIRVFSQPWTNTLRVESIAWLD